MKVILLCFLIGIIVKADSDILNKRDDNEIDVDAFEDKLDQWAANLANERQNKSDPRRRFECTLNVDRDLSYPQPVYIRGGTYLAPSGISGDIRLAEGEEIYIACVGPDRTINHPNIITPTRQALVQCVQDVVVSGKGWLNEMVSFRELECSSNPEYTAQETSDTCFGENRIIRVGYVVDKTFHPLYWSCFDRIRLEVLYVMYLQTPENVVFQTGVSRPYWTAGSFFGDVNINDLYTQKRQNETIGNLVGAELASKYITSKQFLSRGHLAARTDFIFATGQRASFFFINASPQWQPFNAGNWNVLEQNLRLLIAQRGYRTTVYTGTFGVTQLRDQNNKLVDIYLYRDANNNLQLPVPLYFYKVVYDEARRRGTAFVSINNPYYTLEEAQHLQFCPDQCRGNSNFDWIGWNPDSVEVGYSFCCTIDDFRLTVPHLPEFPVDGLLGSSAILIFISNWLLTVVILPIIYARV